MLYVLRRMKKAHGGKIRGATLIGGRVFARVEPPDCSGSEGSRIRWPINTHRELKDLCSKVLYENH